MYECTHMPLTWLKNLLKKVKDLAKELSASFTDDLEHPQQWIYNFSYLTPITVTLSILPTHMLQQWIYFNF